MNAVAPGGLKYAEIEKRRTFPGSIDATLMDLPD
jgi:hypothetical protein